MANIWFKDINIKDVPLVGGKGASLGEMFNNFPIPNGFCIDVNSYKEFIKYNKIDFFELLNKINIEDTNELDKMSKRIRDTIVNGKIPENIANEIVEDYNKLGGFVAVRSSATAEDLPDASFAGQQATFLNVKGERDVLEAVKECWASLFTSRAIYYRKINNFKHEDVFISVVVQKMVDSDKAGVMFTVNPINKNKSEMIIEGSWGLGEMVVSGQVTPDTYIVTKNPIKIKDKHIGTKNKAMTRTKDGKNKILPVSEEKRKMQCMTDKEIKKLAETGIKIEKHYKKPMDVEWAIDKNGNMFILQARPITTL